MDDNRSKRQDEVFSKRVRAGKKRTYFIDVKATRGDDYYLTITESKKDFKNPNFYLKQKIFLYKEDFNKFLLALTETINHVKTELLPEFPFDMYDKDEEYDDFDRGNGNGNGNGNEKEDDSFLDFSKDSE